MSVLLAASRRQPDMCSRCMQVVEFSTLMSGRETLFWCIALSHLLGRLGSEAAVRDAFARLAAQKPMQALCAGLLAFLRHSLAPWVLEREGSERPSNQLMLVRAAE